MNLMRSAYQFGFQISPIILVGGIAEMIPGKMLPLVCITEAAGLIQGVLSGIDITNLDHFHCHFQPVPGGTLTSYQIAQYPFANQTVAANAVINNPNNISLAMTVPMNGRGAYLTKFLTMTALKLALDTHISKGGMFHVATPAFIYKNCVLMGLSDVTTGESKHPQQTWRWDFQKPLLTLEDAENTYNSLMGKLMKGTKTPIPPSFSGPGVSVGSAISGASSMFDTKSVGMMESIF